MENDQKKIFYILTNPTMPDLIKVGITNNLKQRLLALSRFSGIPVAFECHYACEIEGGANKLETAVLDAFRKDRINPKREFIRIAPERIMSIVKLLDRKEVTFVDNVIEDKEERSALEKEKVRESKKAEKTTFAMLKIPVGATLRWSGDEEITVKIVDEKNQIEYEGEHFSMSALAGKFLSRVARGPSYWLYEGEILTDRRARLETEEE